MTDDNRTPVTPDNSGAQFGSDQVPTEKPLFGSEDLEKILTQNRHAQDHIKTLESETARMRAQVDALTEQLNKSRSIDDLIERLQPESDQSGTTATQFDQEQLRKMLKTEIVETLSQAEQRAAEKRNWDQSIEELRKRHGEGYGAYVDKRAAELNLSVSRMEELAKTSPSAFLELVSKEQTRATAPTMGSQTFVSDVQNDMETLFARVNQQRKLTTPEGKEARTLWQDKDFQAKYRMHILNKAQAEGSQFGNKL